MKPAVTLSLALSAIIALSSFGRADMLTPADNVRIGSNTDSKITVGSELSEKEAAKRLYCLGMIDGKQADDSEETEFELERGLTRLEAVILAVRLFGAEEDAAEKAYPHPFSDVPEWASDYVGYLFACGLIDDIALMGEGNFYPNSTESTERFMSYALYALGYRAEDGVYAAKTAAEYAYSLGIYDAGRASRITEDGAESITRGCAALTMYNTFRTVIKGSDRIYSDVLVDRGEIDYTDAVFLLWNSDRAETEEYIKAVGYGENITVPEGYYKIRSKKNGLTLKAVKNENSDRADVVLTEESVEITEIFRVVRTECGTYRIYSVAVGGELGAAIERSGTEISGNGAALCISDAYEPEEFYIRSAPGGGFFFESAPDGSMLSADTDSKSPADGEKTEKVTGVSFSDNKTYSAWELEKCAVTNKKGEELAVFVSRSLDVTQGAYDEYSHQNQNAIDIRPSETRVYSPFDGVIVKTETSENTCNAVWIESTSKVLYADGTLDYMTAAFMHDDDISDISVGAEIKQGEYFYDSGSYGAASGKHVHIAFYRGKYNENMKIGSGDIRAENAVYLPNDTYICSSYGMNWKYVSETDQN